MTKYIPPQMVLVKRCLQSFSVPVVGARSAGSLLARSAQLKPLLCLQCGADEDPDEPSVRELMGFLGQGRCPAPAQTPKFTFSTTNCSASDSVQSHGETICRCA